jgi:serine/threonine protein kinase
MYFDVVVRSTGSALDPYGRVVDSVLFECIHELFALCALRGVAPPLPTELSSAISSAKAPLFGQYEATPLGPVRLASHYSSAPASGAAWSVCSEQHYAPSNALLIPRLPLDCGIAGVTADARDLSLVLVRYDVLGAQCPVPRVAMEWFVKTAELHHTPSTAVWRAIAPLQRCTAREGMAVVLKAQRFVSVLGGTGSVHHFTDRFRAEAELHYLVTLRLQSLGATGPVAPRIGRLIGAAPSAPAPVLVLETVDGFALAKLTGLRADTARAHLPLGVAHDSLPFVVLQWACDVAEAMVFLHTQCGVVHRDITPNNIIVSPDWSRATLIDFGNAKRLIGHTVGSPNGTFVFERDQSGGAMSDTAGVDVYSFGVVCSDLLALLSACGHEEAKEQATDSFDCLTVLRQLSERCTRLGAAAQPTASALASSLGVPNGLWRLISGVLVPSVALIVLSYIRHDLR